MELFQNGIMLQKIPVILFNTNSSYFFIKNRFRNSGLFLFQECWLTVASVKGSTCIDVHINDFQVVLQLKFGFNRHYSKVFFFNISD